MLSHSIDVRVTNMYRGVGTHEIALSRCCCVVLCSAAAAAAALVRHATSCHLMLSLLFHLRSLSAGAMCLMLSVSAMLSY